MSEVIVIKVDENSAQTAIDAAAASQAAFAALLSTSFGVAKPADVPAETGFGYWLSITPGPYPNHGGVVVNANSLALILRTAAGAYSVSQTALDLSSVVGPAGPPGAASTVPGPAGPQGSSLKVPSFINQAYTTLETQVNHLGKDWYNNAPTAIGDIPGTSLKWVERLSGYATDEDLLTFRGSADEIFLTAYADNFKFRPYILLQNGFKPIWSIGDGLFADASGALVDIGVKSKMFNVTPALYFNGETTLNLKISIPVLADSWTISNLPTGVTTTTLTGTGDAVVVLNFSNAYYNDAQFNITSNGIVKTCKIYDLVEEMRISIKLLTDNQEIKLPTISTVVDQSCTVDWGDGVTNSFIDYQAKHIYSAVAGTVFNLRIKGKLKSFTYVSSHGAGQQNTLIGIDKNSFPKQFTHFSLKGCANLERLGVNAFSSFNGTNLINALDGTTNLLTVHKDIFKGLTQVTQIQYLLQNSGLIVIPEGFFNYFFNVKNIDYIFSAAKITTVPNKLFDNMKEITSCNTAFAFLVNLVSVPNELFKNQSKLINTSACFRGCSNLVADANLLYLDMNKGLPTTTSLCFNGATKTTNLNLVPSTWK